ncbi:IS4 family transposase [Candidatus Accumulibacter propinquus]|uniref:IS4 family transposase n=1 Tax=Candidatus Accumulibacter propinquus TaxID=2954380 RepID=UPI003DA919DE
MAYLVLLGCTHPDLSSGDLFSESEWKGGYILAEIEPPGTPPKLREMILRIAMLGGFLGRKCVGEPGVKTQGCASPGSDTSSGESSSCSQFILCV